MDRPRPPPRSAPHPHPHAPPPPTHTPPQVGKRHNLEFINILDDEGNINAHGGPFAGQQRFQVRFDARPLSRRDPRDGVGRALVGPAGSAGPSPASVR